MRRALGDDPDGDAVMGICAGVAVLHEDIFALEIGAQPRFEGFGSS